MLAAPIPPEVPADLFSAFARDAADDADRVGHFLQAVGLIPEQHGQTEAPVRLPMDQLLGLAAGLRLYAWEQNGLRIHREAGLPSAREVILKVLRSGASMAGPATTNDGKLLWASVMALFMERFAWSGRADLGADILLGDAEDDTFIEALADFLWAHRHHGHQELTAREE